MLETTDSFAISQGSGLDPSILEEMGMLIDFEVTKHEKKVIVLVPTRLSSLFLMDFLRKRHLTSKVVVFPFLGKEAMCVQADSRMFHSMICEELGCPLKQSTRKVSRKLVSKLSQRLVRSPVERFRQVMKSTGYCPYYLQFKLIRRSDVIVATHGFATPSGIMFLCNIMAISLDKVSVVLVLPDLLFKGKEIVIDISILKDLNSRFEDEEIADLLLIPRFTLLPLPIDPLVFLALRHKVLRNQISLTHQDGLLNKISSLESAIDFEEPFVFLSNEFLHIVEGNPRRTLERLESMVPVKKVLSSATSTVVGSSQILSELPAFKSRNVTRIHFVQLPADFSLYSDSSASINRIFRILSLLLRNRFLRMIVLPSESIIETVEMMFSQCLNSRRLISPYVSDFELIESLQTLFSLRKIPLLLSLDKIHQALAFSDLNLSPPHFSSDFLIVQIGKPISISSLAQEYLLHRWTLTYGPQIKQQYEWSIAQASLLLDYEIAMRMKSKAVVIFDASSDWLPKEVPITYHRSVDLFVQSFLSSS